MKPINLELDQIQADITEAEADIRKGNLRPRSIALMLLGVKLRLKIVTNLIDCN